MAKQIKPNYEIAIKSCIYKLQTTYSEYKKTVNKYLGLKGFDNEGNLYTFKGYEETFDKAVSLIQEVYRLQNELDELRRKAKDDKDNN